MKRFKKLLKNKKGSFLFMGVIILPIVIFLITDVIATAYRERNIINKYQSALDNEAFALAELYGSRYQYGDELVSYFETGIVDELIEEHLNNFVTFLDGYDAETWDGNWTHSYLEYEDWNKEVPKEKRIGLNESSQFLKISLKVTLPNVDTNSYSTFYKNSPQEWATRKDAKGNNLIVFTITSYSAKI